MDLLDDEYRSDKYNRTLEELETESYSTDAYRYIREGFELVKKEPALFIAFTIVFALIQYVLTRFRMGTLLSLLINPCLAAGWYLVARKISHHEPVQMKDFFEGFRAWQRLIPYSVIAQVFVAIGLFLLVAPGFYLLIGYLFIIPIILFYPKDLQLMDVLEGSRKVIHKKWWNFFGLFWLLVGVNLLGALALGIGLLISIPTTACALYMAYEDVFGVPAGEPDLDRG